MKRSLGALCCAFFVTAAFAAGPPEIPRFSTGKPGGPPPAEWKHLQLASFKTRLAANPVRPFGARSTGVTGSLEILPPGSRAYYCLAVAGLARSLATYLLAGVDYCALAPQLILDRDNGLAGVVGDPFQHRILHIRTAQHPSAAVQVQINATHLPRSGCRCDHP